MQRHNTSEECGKLALRGISCKRRWHAKLCAISPLCLWVPLKLNGIFLIRHTQKSANPTGGKINHKKKARKKPNHETVEMPWFILLKFMPLLSPILNSPPHRDFQEELLAKSPSIDTTEKAVKTDSSCVWEYEGTVPEPTFAGVALAGLPAFSSGLGCLCIVWNLH